MNAGKINLLGLTKDEMTAFATGIGEPRYRGAQLFQWIYAKETSDFSAMTNIAKTSRRVLGERAAVFGVRAVTSTRSRVGGTTKFLFELPDGARIETVLIPPASHFQEDDRQRLTLCVSTQVGCPLDCRFCATATMGFHRNLTAGEIVDQVLQVKMGTGRKITNVVFMGMGEPMLNYENVMNAAGIMAEGLGIAMRRITVSTAGWADGIRRMGDEQRRMKLAVSLHSAVDSTRTMLMPVNKRFGVGELGKAVEYYYRKTRQPVTFEQVFFDGVNDTDREVDRLTAFVRRVPCKINVIPFHSIAAAGPRGVSSGLSPSRRAGEIVDRLRSKGIPVFVRSSAGLDIEAACGQLVVVTENKRRARTASVPGVTSPH